MNKIWLRLALTILTISTTVRVTILTMWRGPA